MTTTRRTFLTVVAATSAATCLGPLSGCATPLSGTHTAGNIADLPEGGTLAVDGQPLVVLRDAAGIWAVTTLCTHLDCDMLEQGTVTPDQLTCACHGSVFTGDGDVVTGPATRQLDNFAVSMDSNGLITVDADAMVDPGVRTAVTTS